MDNNLTQALSEIKSKHDTDSDLTVRISYFTSEKGECWFVTQKMDDAKGEVNESGLMGLILTRNQVCGLISHLQDQLNKTVPPNKE